MKILKSGKKSRTLKGECQNCNCVIECLAGETQTLIDRDTQPGMATQYVKCPECGKDYLWVK